MNRTGIHGFITAILTSVISGCIFFVSCNRSNDYHSCEGIVWNTTWHVTYKGAPELEDSILRVFNAVGASLSFFDERSLVSRLNAGIGVQCDSMLMSVYKTARKVNLESGGAFDPTLGPLIDAWGFGKGHTPTSDTARVAEILRYVGIEKTYLEGDSIIKNDARTRFNFSAIAKGYGCDAVAAMLKRNGVSDWMVEIGGEISAGGESPRGGAWKIAVDKPVESQGEPVHEIQTVIALTDCGMATSGNYRNFHKQGAEKYGHTIDITTGRPSVTDVLSATVVAPTCMEADAYATACMAMGSKRASAMLDSLRLDALLILSDSVIATGVFK